MSTSSFHSLIPAYPWRPRFPTKVPAQGALGIIDHVWYFPGETYMEGGLTSITYTNNRIRPRIEPLCQIPTPYLSHIMREFWRWRAMIDLVQRGKDLLEVPGPLLTQIKLLVVYYDSIFDCLFDGCRLSRPNPAWRSDIWEIFLAEEYFRVLPEQAPDDLNDWCRSDFLQMDVLTDLGKAASSLLSPSPAYVHVLFLKTGLLTTLASPASTLPFQPPT